ncbi:lipopolysaccharide biosynthesis protein [Flavobacterium caeni]|uniref:Membrane protein involved in the export of O-antigen and teichoic acid n=1 Tax=Flavobacterium caeni TaxID=490189 RepID=A0A1G5JC75_9FLAO|nr:MATE family efflux transporter [Flavobacterium caeni]SCY85501.1 Membrane protein involved in the export of O-antigen and teichoic acid [Flavobacterium caeni]
MLKRGKEYLYGAVTSPLFLQSVKTMALRVFGIVVLFALTVFLTRNYPAEIVGQYDFIRTFLLVMGSFVILGTDQSILYFSGVLKKTRNLGELRRIYYKMLRIQLLISVAVLAIFLAIGELPIERFLNDDSIYPVVFRAMVVLFFYAVTFFNTEVFRALDKVYVAEFFRNTFKYVSVVIGAIWLVYIVRLEFLVDTFLVGFLALAVISTIMIHRYFSRNIQNDEDLGYGYREIIRKSYPIAVSTMAIFLLTTLDIVLLKKYYGDKMVAQYGVAVKFMTIINMVIQMININVSTKIAAYHFSQETDLLQRTIKSSSRLIVAFVIPVIFVTVFFSREILGLFGPEYVVADQTMKILVLGQGITALFGVAPIYLNMTNRQGYFQVVLVLAVLLNLTLNSYLIPIYGMQGAAVAYIISMISWNIVITLKAYRSDRVKLFFH